MSSSQTISKNIGEIIARYAPISLGADLSNFTDNEKSAISKLVSVGKLIDRFVKHSSCFHNILIESIKYNIVKIFKNL